MKSLIQSELIELQQYLTPQELEELDLLLNDDRQFVRSEPIRFAENVLKLSGDKFYLDPWQVETMEAVADAWRHKVGLPTKFNHDGKTLFTIRAMHGPGKTFTVAAIMHWFNEAFRGRIVCTAPKEKQLATRLWPAFRKISIRAGKEYASHIKIDSLRITWNDDEDHCALIETASQPENLAGYHDDYMLIIVDEASGVSEDMFPVIESIASTGTLVIVLLIGNPTKNQGTFFQSHNIPKVAKHYYQVHVDLDKTTRVSKAWVQQMIDKYGRDSPVVKIRCFGEFADADEAQLIAYAWLSDAFGREGIGEGQQPKLRITCDVADGGADFTVITAALIYNYESVLVLKQEQHNFPSSESPILAAKAAHSMFNRYNGNPDNGDDFVIDSLGVGAGTAGYLMERRLPVIAYKGGAGSDDPGQYRNRRTQSYIVMRDAHRDGKIAYAEDFLAEGDFDDFTAQMCSVRTMPGTERLEELETKESMKRRGLKSPDKADGIAMLFATSMPSTGTGLLEVIGFGELLSANQDW